MDTVHGTLFHTYLMQGTGDIDRLILDQACRMLKPRSFNSKPLS